MLDQKHYEEICRRQKTGEKLYWVLFDPDDYTPHAAAEMAKKAETCGADAVLIGGSLIHTDHLDDFVDAVKNAVTIPVILFPGDASQVSRSADAILFLTLISGRNPDFLIGEQLKGAPLIKKHNIEPIATAYMLIESGTVTSVEFMSNTRPIPREKPGIAALHALAAECMGQKLIYLEAGSGAKISVPEQTVAAVKQHVSIPVIVGGGIRDAETAVQKLKAGADIIVTGNSLSAKDGEARMVQIAEVIKGFSEK